VIQLDGSEVTVCIWDTAGQEKFFSLTKNYFKNADGVLVVFDLTDKPSFDRNPPPTQASTSSGSQRSRRSPKRTARRSCWATNAIW
jgi:GTPase SAR1 family protein